MAAPSIVTIYSKNKNFINEQSLAGAVLNLALVTNAYVPSAIVTGDSIWSGVSANEIANGNGYTTGGIALPTPVATAITSGYKMMTGNVSWTASGTGIPAWRYGVIYVVGSLGGLTNPVIGYFIGDSTPADVPLTSVGNTLGVNCPAAGWFDMT